MTIEQLEELIRYLRLLAHQARQYAYTHALEGNDTLSYDWHQAACGLEDAAGKLDELMTFLNGQG
jgi:hypothetical protein